MFKKLAFKFRVGRPSPALIVALLALTAALSGVAVAAIPAGQDGSVTACLSSDGSLKVIDVASGQTCQSGETTLKLASTDAVGRVANADRLDGKDSTAFLSTAGKAADADKLDGIDSTEILRLPVSATYKLSDYFWNLTHIQANECKHPDVAPPSGSKVGDLVMTILPYHPNKYVGLIAGVSQVRLQPANPNNGAPATPKVQVAICNASNYGREAPAEFKLVALG